MDPVEALRRTGGAASWRTLRHRGVTWRALDQARRAGAVDRLRRGAYALPDADPALASAVRLGGVLAGPSAAVHHGYDVLTAAHPLVAVPRNWSHARMHGVQVLRVDLAEDESDGVATSRLRTVLDCARRLQLRDALVITDSALRHGLDPVRLREAAHTANGTGARNLRRVVALADGRAESVIETCVRLAVVELGLPFEPQARIHGVGRVDLLVDGWLALEADGFAHHSDRAAYREDRRRNTALVAAGYTWVRFSYEDVVHRPEQVKAALREVVARRGHCPCCQRH